MAGEVTSGPPIIVPEPNPFWKKNAENLVGESISSMADVAKQIIVVTSLLEGLYFHAITFSDLRGMLDGGQLLVYLMPIAPWLASLIFAMWSLSPKDYQININSSHESKQTFEEIVNTKYYRLKMAEVFLIASFLPLMIATYCYLR